MLCTSPSPSFHSDYFTSSEDEILGSPNRTLPAHALPHCPNCNSVYNQPQILPCGHSYCEECVVEMLNIQPKRSETNRIRMGLSSYKYKSVRKDIKTDRSFRSPACKVCGANAKLSPPVPNYELSYMLSYIQQQSLQEYDNPIYDRTLIREEPEQEESEISCIRETRIGLLGASGVGKTTLRRVQYGNEIIFRALLQQSYPADINDTFMMDIIDSNMAEMETSHGFLIIYSTTDRESFNRIQCFHQMITDFKGSRVPVVLIATKTDNEKKRQVQSFEGQTLARTFGCPFLEISSKTNENVNEAFIELLRITERQRIDRYFEEYK